MGALAAWAALAACVICGALAAHARAQAGEPPIELSWSAPEGCSSRQDVLARTRRHLPQASAAPPPLRVVAAVTQRGAGFELTLELHGRELEARKQLRVESCEAAASAAALLIALALDPNAVMIELRDPTEPAPAPAPEPSAPTPGHAEPAPTPAAPDEPAPPSRTPPARASAPAAPEEPSAPAPASASVPLELGFAVGAALSADFAILPQEPAWGLRPWLALSIERVRVSGGVAFWLRGEAASELAAASASGHAIAGELTLGYELRWARARLVPYALGELAQITVQTRGITDPATAAATWVGLGAGLQLAYGLFSGFHATLDPAVIIPFQAPRWRVHTSTGDATLFPAPAASFRLSAGLSFAVP